MRLNNKELAKLLQILEDIDAGKIRPSIPGPVGRFLRQYADGASIVRAALRKRSIDQRRDGAVSGSLLGEVSFQQLSRLEVSLLHFPLGEVADALTVSEELGAVTYMRMWLKAASAQSTFNVLRSGPGVRLSGDYRWTPQSRLTTGGAAVLPVEAAASWTESRCLKMVADDVNRPAHALEFVIDYRMGRPGLKFFRTVAALRRQNEWVALPALGKPRVFPVGRQVGSNDISLVDGTLAMFLVYNEPWSPIWEVADARAIDAGQAYAHSLAWVDVQRELEALPLTRELASGVRQNLLTLGIALPEGDIVVPMRCLLPAAVDLIRGIRRLD